MALGLIIAELFALIVVTAYLLYHYASPQIPKFLLGITYTAWYLGFLGVLLLPIDIAYVQRTGNPSPSITKVWQGVYWTTFMMGWVICPLLQDFCVAGDFTAKEKLKTALRKHVRLLVVAIAAGVAILLWLLVTGQHIGALLGLAMAGGNTYGLLLIVALLGHGLVEVPRGLFREARPQRALLRLYFRAAELDTALYDAMFELEDAENEVGIHRWAVHMIQCSGCRTRRTSMFGEERSSIHLTSMPTRPRGGGGLDEPAFGDTRASAGVMVGAQGGSRGQQTWLRKSMRLMKKQQWLHTDEEDPDEICVRMGAVSWGLGGVMRVPPPQVAYAARRAQWGTLVRKVTALGPWCRYWLTGVRAAVLRALAFTAGGLSLLLLWSYLALAAGAGLSPLGWLLGVLRSAFLTQAALLVPLLHASVCLYRTLFKLKLFGAFSLQAPRSSQPSALLFNAQQMIRLQFPLGYSFLLMLNFHRTTSLQLLMSNMTVVPILGTSFNHYAPLVMVVLCAFTLFNGYARLLGLLGVEHEAMVAGGDGGGQTAAASPEAQEKVQDGKRLVARFRSKQPRHHNEPSEGVTGSRHGRRNGGNGNSFPRDEESELSDSFLTRRQQERAEGNAR
ncbi:unnamed protein product, partial [Heterosigma akashiwo]